MKDQEPEETIGIFKFWYEKLLMRVSFAFAFFAFLGVFVYAYFTEITLENPGDTAPFVGNLTNQVSQKSLAESQSLPLDTAHRTDSELKEWITTAISESMFFDSTNYSTIKQQVSPYFTASGMKQYDDYLRSSGILNNIQQNNYRMSIFIEDKPLLMNSLEMEGVYRWLYRLPLTISFVPRNTVTLQESRNNIVNRKMNLQIQLRRVRLQGNPDAVQIESWNMSARRGQAL